MRPPVSEVLETSASDQGDARSVGLGRVDALLASAGACHGEEREDDPRSVGRPTRREGERTRAVDLERNLPQTGSVGVDDEEHRAVESLVDAREEDLAAVRRPVRQPVVVRVRQTVGRDLMQAGAVAVLDEEGAALVAIWDRPGTWLRPHE